MIPDCNYGRYQEQRAGKTVQSKNNEYFIQSQWIKISIVDPDTTNIFIQISDLKPS